MLSFIIVAPAGLGPAYYTIFKYFFISDDFSGNPYNLHHFLTALSVIPYFLPTAKNDFNFLKSSNNTNNVGLFPVVSAL